ncbi:lipoate--protein ligase family protein [Schlesneria paludicola]|uniref:lipoate--protein ligase family protein n=1 Tax=Schlesneria paludicola TaxID=360056 RepID=UPI00029AB584|nr:lipoate--protein ligase family protein [Schlesneria paludicola]
MTDTPVPESLWPGTVLRSELTLPTPSENLALDEAILHHVDQSPDAGAYLRLWQPSTYFVVLGRSNNVATEVDVDHCAAAGIPILRRASGGGTVLVGPGCLCYSLVLPLNPLLRTLGVSGVTSELMERTAKGLRSMNPEIEVRGTSDLVCGGLKFSGNAQRWLRNAFIHHGTLLHDFDLALLERCLRHPSREPDYRQARRHPDFVGNLNARLEDLKRCVSDAWCAIDGPIPPEIVGDVQRIVDTRSQHVDWNIAPPM